MNGKTIPSKKLSYTTSTKQIVNLFISSSLKHLAWILKTVCQGFFNIYQYN